MGETLLKQEFREKDVQRMRNIVKGKYGDSTGTQIGYSKKDEEHKEGDIWEENDKMWTIKNGIKQSFTKLDNVKETFRMPLICPKCQNRMKGNSDKKMFRIHGECATCVAVKESALKREGKYEDYVREFVNRNINTDLEEAEQFIMEFAQSSVSRFVTEDGDIEESAGDVDKKAIVEKWKSEMEELKKKIKTNEA